MSNNKKTSSVDELWDYLKGWIPQGQYAGVREVYLEAKAMHKEETTDFANKSIKMALCEDIQNPFNLDEIYNETYGGNK